MDKDGQQGVQVDLTAETARDGAIADGAAGVVCDEAAGRETEELTARLQRLQADFDNFRRRSRTEAEQLSLFVTANLVSGFLPVMDNFERALSAGDEQNPDSVYKGLELIYRQLEKVLTDIGVEKIRALGEQFSPQLHEAVMNTQNAALPDGQIDCVLETGYKLKDRIIRHSKVRVVSNS